MSITTTLQSGVMAEFYCGDVRFGTLSNTINQDAAELAVVEFLRSTLTSNITEGITLTDSDLTHFVKLVREMREAQKAYFRHRLPSDLERSKKSEREVDAALHQLTQRHEPQLFADEEK